VAELRTISGETVVFSRGSTEEMISSRFSMLNKNPL
jgi:hypothetical protein